MLKFSDRKEHHQRIVFRFSNSMAAACTSASILHFFLILFYVYIKVPEMCIYAAVTFFLFLVWRRLFKIKWVKIAFLLGSINSVIGIVLADYFIGWGSNFNVYLIVLPAAFLVYTGWKKWESVFYLITLLTVYLILYFTFLNFSGVYNVNSEILKYLAMINTVSAAGILVIILLFLNASILKIQGDLENKNKRLKRKAVELDRSLQKEKELGDLKSSFVSTASHQFRTPLTGIKSNSELLQMLSNTLDVETSKRFKKVTDRITGEITKMTDLMDEVLILGKVTAGNVKYTPEEIDLVEFCEKLAKELSLVSTDGRMLNVAIKGVPYNAHLDPKLLTHSLSNLISNAFKYSLGEKDPELSIQFKPKELVVSVIDYGMGIPEDERLHLFEPFFRANNVSEIQGTGLGLSIAKEYIEINKGIITVTSTERKGSRFELTFHK